MSNIPRGCSSLNDLPIIIDRVNLEISERQGEDEDVAEE